MNLFKISVNIEVSLETLIDQLRAYYLICIILYYFALKVIVVMTEKYYLGFIYCEQRLFRHSILFPIIIKCSINDYYNLFKQKLESVILKKNYFIAYFILIALLLQQRISFYLISGSHLLCSDSHFVTSLSICI